jgi:PAS domain S-box-containing protein
MENEQLDTIKFKKLGNNTGVHSKIRDVIEKTDVGTWEWNIQTGEMIFSQKWAQMIGYDLNEFGSINIKTLENIIHPEDLNKSIELLKKHFAGELPYYKFESRVKHKNGHWAWVCERGYVTSWTEDGKPLIMFGTHTDITKRKQTEQALENYINTLNHDLRNPLSIIIGYSSLLLEEGLTTEDIKKFSTIINGTGKKMLKMMESYLALAKVEKGQGIIKKKKHTVIEIVNEIERNFSDFKNSNKLEIVFKDLENNSQDNSLIQKSIFIDEILFHSIISNLLQNAVEASAKDDQIILNVYEDGGLCLSFFNTGEIPKEIQKKLFKKFFSTKKNGTGIGLYSARLVARAHGGDIQYQSVVGGTRFVLNIPFS